MTSSPAVLQTLSWARRLGFKPVPLFPKSKAAIFKDYAQPGYQPPDDDFWRKSDYGIGLVTGPKASGPVDVDLDCDEAVMFAPLFLPPTPAVFGRKSKPASHYLYRVKDPECAKIAFTDPVQIQTSKGTMATETVVEIRADGGHQTVFPGSIHQDTGEPIEWTNVPFPDVPEVEIAVLERSVKMLAVACLLSKHVWLPGQRNEAVKHISGMGYTLGWTEEECLNIVSACCQWHNDKDKTRAMTVRNTYKKAANGAKVTGARSLRKALGDDRVVDRILSWTGTGQSSTVAEWNERFAVVDYAGKFRVACTDVTPGTVPTFYSKDDFLAVYSTDYIEIDGKVTTKSKLWLGSSRRRHCTAVDFRPGEDDAGTVLNLWTGWAVQPVEDRSKCSAWHELLFEFICGKDKALYKWMVHWFANIVREPQSKSLTAPVIIGKQGAGKSLLVSYVGRMLGSGFLAVTNPEHLYGKFNAHTATCLLLHSEEALYGGEKKHRGIIKSLITDETRVFEQKNMDARMIRNHMRLILTSNEAHAAPAEAGDRRFTVIDLKDRKAPADLIKRVMAEMRSDGPAALLNDFLTMEYDPAIPRTNIKSVALENMKIQGLPPIEDWWKDVLSDGVILPDFLSWALSPEKEDWPAIVGSIALYQWAIDTMKRQNVRNIPSANVFYHQLAKLVGVKLRKERRTFTNPGGDGLPNWVAMLPDRQTAILNMPGLSKCRRAFEKHLGQKLEWPGEEPEHERPSYERY